MKTPRIAILGFAIESNRFAPVSTRADFLSRAYLQDTALLLDARSEAPVMTPEIPAFVRTMDALRPWTPVPILFANAESGGPVEHTFFADTLREFEQRLHAALPLDAVYICEHGAAIKREIPVGRFGEERDLDGALLLLVSDAGRFIAGTTIVVDGGQVVALRG